MPVRLHLWLAEGRDRVLRWEQVNRQDHTIRLATTKSERPRLLALPDGFWQLIESQWKKRAFAKHVFHRNGRPLGDFSTAWEKANAAAGMPEKHFHDFRRTAIRNLSRAGVPDVVIMTISGHTTRSVFDRYNIVSEADQREALDKLTSAR